MNKELRRIATLFRNEIRIMSSIKSIIRRRNVVIVGFFAVALLVGKGPAVAHLSLSLPSLRGYTTAFAPPATNPVEETKRGPALFGLAVHINSIQRSIDVIGAKIQSETVKHWDGLQSETVKHWDGLAEHVGREWDKLTQPIAKLFSKERHHGTEKLDEVLRTFQSVLSGNDVDTARLLEACRAHLLLMKSGGSALRLVAKDMEGNLNKAESLFKQLSPAERRSLTTLLEKERESGIHDGNALEDDSAAMGLLWIRRSLAFQLDLYASLIPKNGRHPKDAAIDAYYKTLSPYHGWLLQKVFPLSLSQMPERQVFIAKFGGREADELDRESEGEIVKKLKTLVATWEPIIDTWKHEFERLDLEDTRQV